MPRPAPLIDDAQDKLLQIIRQWGCGTKGGAAGLFVDTPRLLGPVTGMRDTFLMRRQRKKMLQTKDYRIISSIHQQIREGLPSIFLNEAERLRGWANVCRTRIRRR